MRVLNQKMSSHLVTRNLPDRRLVGRVYHTRVRHPRQGPQPSNEFKVQNDSNRQIYVSLSAKHQQLKGTNPIPETDFSAR